MSDRPKRRPRIYRKTLMQKAIRHYIQCSQVEIDANERYAFNKLYNDVDMYTPLEVEAMFKDLDVERIRKQ